MTFTGQPHIILLYGDCLRSDRLSACGYNTRRTPPHLESLAAGGTTFESAIASAPWTLPSQASAFTGLLPHEHQANEGNLQLQPGIPTVAERLAGRGYLTASFSPDNGWLSDATGLMRGFSIRHGPDGELPWSCWWDYLSRSLRNKRTLHRSARKALAFIKYIVRQARRGDRPVFVFINDMVTHEPYFPVPESWRGMDCTAPAHATKKELQKHFKYYNANPDKINSEQWKYILHETGHDELYHLRSDPGETRNLAARRSDITAELRKVIEDGVGNFTKNSQESRGERLSEPIKKRLRELGYI